MEEGRVGDLCFPYCLPCRRVSFCYGVFPVWYSTRISILAGSIWLSCCSGCLKLDISSGLCLYYATFVICFGVYFGRERFPCPIIIHPWGKGDFFRYLDGSQTQYFKTILKSLREMRRRGIYTYIYYSYFLAQSGGKNWYKRYISTLRDCLLYYVHLLTHMVEITSRESDTVMTGTEECYT